VDVGGTAVVVTRQQRVEGGNAVVVGRLNTTERGALEHAGVVGVAHAGVALNTNVDALGCIVSIAYKECLRLSILTVELELQMST
jgi:hypothetical protein